MSSIHGVNVGGTLYDVTDSSNVAPLESTNFASRNYAKGRCLIMMDGLLYEAMSAITSGDALVVNTNVKRTTLDELVANLGTSNALIAPTENGVTSSDDYAIGAQIARSGLLYNVIDTIAEGDAFVVGTNIALAGSVTEQLNINKNVIDNEIATRAKLGAHNFLPNVWTNDTKNGVTLVANGDGTVTVTRNSASNENAIFNKNNPFTLENGKSYILNGCPSGGAITLYRILIGIYYSDNTSTIVSDYGEGASFTVENKTITRWEIRVDIMSNANPSNLVFKPMIRLASDPSTKFTPYAMTNRELMEIIEIHTLVDNVTASVNNANTWENTGISFTLTERALIQVLDSAINSGVLGVAVSNSNSFLGGSLICEDSNITGKQLVGVLNAGTYYVWAKHATANVNNTFIVRKLMTV